MNDPQQMNAYSYANNSPVTYTDPGGTRPILGESLTIPVGTSFQFRSTGAEPLTVVAITMPPWAGDQEAEAVTGCPDW